MANNERFKRIYTLQGPLYLEGSPLLIAAGALLLDQQTGKCVAQIKFTGVTNEMIAGVKLAIESIDMEGLSLGAIEASYTDLTLASGAFAGDRKPIYLPSTNARSINVRATTVVFAGGKVWKNETLAPFAPLPEAKALSLTGDLAFEYRCELGEANVGQSGRCDMQQAMGLWQCGCEQWNSEAERKCLHCGLERAWQEEHREESGLTERLQQRREREAEEQRIREEKERKRAEEQARLETIALKEAEEAAVKRKARNKKLMKIGAVVAAVVVVLLVITMGIIPAMNRSKGLKLIRAHEFEQAYWMYARNNDGYVQYRDALKEYAEEQFNKGEYENALLAYDELGNVNDITNAYYMVALKKCDAGDHPAAYDLLTDALARTDVFDQTKWTSLLTTYRDNICYRWSEDMIAAGDTDKAFEVLDLIEWTLDKNVKLAEANEKVELAVARKHLDQVTETVNASLEAGDYQGAYDYLLQQTSDDQTQDGYVDLLQQSAIDLVQDEYIALINRVCIDWATVQLDNDPDAAMTILSYCTKTEENAAQLDEMIAAHAVDVAALRMEKGDYTGAAWLYEYVGMTGEYHYAMAYQCESEGDYAAAKDHYDQAGDTADAAERAQTVYRRSLVNPEVGDLVYFGTKNGKPIAWHVLKVEDGEALLLSRDCLQDSAVMYNYDDVYVWEKSKARDVLNNRLYYELFTDEERVLIESTPLQNDNKVTTYDFLFLLSKNEITQMVPMEIRDNDDYWWTRTSAGYDDAYNVDIFGEFDKTYTNYDDRGLRPAMTIHYLQSADETLEGAADRLMGEVYDTAIALKDEGKYDDAIAQLKEVGLYKDAPAQILLCYELKGDEAIANARFAQAAEAYLASGNNEKLYYAQAMELLSGAPVAESPAEAYAEAVRLLSLAGDTFGANEMLFETQLSQLKYAYVGDIIYLGTMADFETAETDDAESEAEGMAAHPIAWMVVSGDGDIVELMAVEPVAKLPFNNEWASVDWAESSIRSWLNEDFLNTAFSDQEKELLLYSDVDGVSDILYLPELEQLMPDEAGVNAHAWTLEMIDEAAINYVVNVAKQTYDKDDQLLLTRTMAEDDLVSVKNIKNVRQSENIYVNTPALVAPVMRVMTNYEAVLAERERLQNAYAAADTLLADGDYEAAMLAFEELGAYEDSADKAQQARELYLKDCYAAADALEQESNFADAYEGFVQLGDYADSPARAEILFGKICEQQYADAVALMDDGDYIAAHEIFAGLGDYLDSAAKAQEAQDLAWGDDYAAAQALLDAGDYAAAQAAFEALGSYADSEQKAQLAAEIPLKQAYDAAVALLNDGEYEAAAQAFHVLGEYADSAAQALQAEESFKAQQYNAAIDMWFSGELDLALAIFESLGDYQDSAAYIEEILAEMYPPEQPASTIEDEIAALMLEAGMGGLTEEVSSEMIAEIVAANQDRDYTEPQQLLLAFAIKTDDDSAYWMMDDERSAKLTAALMTESGVLEMVLAGGADQYYIARDPVEERLSILAGSFDGTYFYNYFPKLNICYMQFIKDFTMDEAAAQLLYSEMGLAEWRQIAPEYMWMIIEMYGFDAISMVNNWYD